jgi:sterol desaturase/sphingolipid hydroxylase (fatty acid hydroxylase superfamily)
LYDLAFTHGRVITWKNGSTGPWLLAFVGVDFCYYWFHRKGHELRVLWTIHVVHHQSPRYNISVALRQPWLSDLSAIFFYAPLPILGVPAEPFFVAVALLSMYQVLLHTEIDRALLKRAKSTALSRAHDAYAFFFNVPSHHRVHHARNLAPFSRNFGATLIVWDRLFGTFMKEPEGEPVVYGTRDAGPRLSAWASQGFIARALFTRQPVDAEDREPSLSGTRARIVVAFSLATLAIACVALFLRAHLSTPWRVITVALAFGMIRALGEMLRRDAAHEERRDDFHREESRFEG